MLMPGLFGLRADEVVGKPIIEILGETEAEAMLKRLTTERPRDFRIWNDRRDQQQHALDPRGPKRSRRMPTGIWAAVGAARPTARRGLWS